MAHCLKHKGNYSDEFWMLQFKVVPCTKTYAHSWSSCPCAHPGETARRRDPTMFSYQPVLCPNVKSKNGCPTGDACGYAHNVFEQWLHPQRYKALMCTYGSQCTRPSCFFAHSLAELRVPWKGGPGQGPEPLAGGGGEGAVGNGREMADVAAVDFAGDGQGPPEGRNSGGSAGRGSSGSMALGPAAGGQGGLGSGGYAGGGGGGRGRMMGPGGQMHSVVDVRMVAGSGLTTEAASHPGGSTRRGPVAGPNTDASHAFSAPLGYEFEPSASMHADSATLTAHASGPLLCSASNTSGLFRPGMDESPFGGANGGSLTGAHSTSASATLPTPFGQLQAHDPGANRPGSDPNSAASLYGTNHQPPTVNHMNVSSLASLGIYVGRMGAPGPDIGGVPVDQIGQPAPASANGHSGPLHHGRAITPGPQLQQHLQHLHQHQQQMKQLQAAQQQQQQHPRFGMGPHGRASSRGPSAAQLQSVPSSPLHQHQQQIQQQQQQQQQIQQQQQHNQQQQQQIQQQQQQIQQQQQQNQQPFAQGGPHGPYAGLGLQRVPPQALASPANRPGVGGVAGNSGALDTGAFSGPAQSASALSGQHSLMVDAAGGDDTDAPSGRLGTWVNVPVPGSALAQQGQSHLPGMGFAQATAHAAGQAPGAQGPGRGMGFGPGGQAAPGGFSAVGQQTGPGLQRPFEPLGMGAAMAGNGDGLHGQLQQQLQHMQLQPRQRQQQQQQGAADAPAGQGDGAGLLGPGADAAEGPARVFRRNISSPQMQGSLGQPGTGEAASSAAAAAAASGGGGAAHVDPDVQMLLLSSLQLQLSHAGVASHPVAASFPAREWLQQALHGRAASATVPYLVDLLSQYMPAEHFAAVRRLLDCLEEAGGLLSFFAGTGAGGQGAGAGSATALAEGPGGGGGTL